MFTIIAVLVSPVIDEVEAEEVGVDPGTPRKSEDIERELERLLAPYSRQTTLNIRKFRDGSFETVPNYGAKFDFWEVDDDLFTKHYEKLFSSALVREKIFREVHKDRGKGWEIDYKEYPVISAPDLPLEDVYHAIITPYGEYCEIPYWAPDDQASKARSTQIVRNLIAKHADCLAVVCMIHY